MIWVALAHAVVALVCVGLLRVRARPILDVHPADKPLKFALSIAAFLGSLAFVMPVLAVSDATRCALATLLSATMSAEMIVIAVQALRGRRSHFNVARPLDAAVVVIMLVGIAVMLPTMATVAVLASVRPLATSALMSAAWRAALWIFLSSAVSGFGMGARGGHSVGGADGAPGMAVTGWSTAHGDLRISHFFALHALQIIPIAAAVLAWLPLGSTLRGGLLALVVAANAGLVGWTWRRAVVGRPLPRPHAPPG